ncbi:tRNA pseudouridine(55) synthase TruB [Accumulibacter sp.]|uniref:tRNA pseudouridine(55) synthase TruB n=1 Tax=Accumulibacter sp. TaxID=2053492 RepID=UPI0025F14AF1|nr:tRNA pseudouridine(55) synthase TruB [Accumulibacter sp.]MCP5229827.1 tRNA pseudouridine(55) synthase TruB [Accumulibacter sp.]
MNTRKGWRRVDGVLLLDKPTGMTSNAALQAARRLFSAAKAGHTGTLDPLASGLLPLCFGEATKFAVDLLTADKTYEADLLFGATTDTGDADGNVVARHPVDFGPDDLEAALARFRGPIRQVPPMYSALKRDGKPLYQLARQGIEVEREAREVTVHQLQLLDFSVDSCRLRVACSKGTYIRSLAEDLGSALGCGAHLTALRRVAVGALAVGDAVTLDQLAGHGEAERERWLLAPDTLLQSLPAVDLDDEAAARFVRGNPVDCLASPGKCRVYGLGRLLGLGQADGQGSLQPRRVVASA